MGAQRALGRSRRSADALDADIVALIDRVTSRLRKARRACRTVVLRLRFDDFSRATRSRTLPQATAQTEPILGAARRLLIKATPMIESRGLTLVGVALANLEEGGAIQLSLPFGRQPASALDLAIDEVRDRFGSAALTRAVLVGRDQGLTVPMLPD
jgi:DNA polymerase-4